MSRSMKPIVTSGTLLVGIAITACTQMPGGVQIAAVPASDVMPADRALALPAVTVVAPQPYASGNGPRASSGNRIPQSHFQPWPGYYSDVSLRPYTSGLGPRASSGNRIPMSHFRVWPGYDSDVSMHPYTSNLGPCPERHEEGCEPSRAWVIKPSHYERSPFMD